MAATTDDQQLAAEEAIAQGDEANRAAQKRKDALTARDAVQAVPEKAEPKARKQTTR